MQSEDFICFHVRTMYIYMHMCMFGRPMVTDRCICSKM